MQIPFILFFLFVPFVISYLTTRISILNKLGTVLICYAIGLIVGHSPLVDSGIHELQDMLINASILIALPILFFDTRRSHLKHLAGITAISTLTALLALLITVYSGYYMFGENVQEGWKVSGLLVGLYTGGTPNLASIKTALDVSDDIYIGVHTFDTALGAIYLLFLLTFGKTFFRRFLPKYAMQQKAEKYIKPELANESVKVWLSRFDYKKGTIILFMGVGIAAIGAGVGLQFDETYQMTVIILLITTLGILTSMFKFTERLGDSSMVGMYLINVFSLTIASRANFFEIMELDGILYVYVIFVLFVTFGMHFFLAKIFKVDADTMMITSTALICSPPFVPVIAGSLKNKELLIPGVTVGILGYAIGNYLGVLIAYLLK